MKSWGGAASPFRPAGGSGWNAVSSPRGIRGRAPTTRGFYTIFSTHVASPDPIILLIVDYHAAFGVKTQDPHAPLPMPLPGPRPHRVVTGCLNVVEADTLVPTNISKRVFPVRCRRCQAETQTSRKSKRTRNTRVEFYERLRSKQLMKVCRSETNCWWRHLTSKLTNVAVKCLRLH